MHTEPKLTKMLATTPLKTLTSLDKQSRLSFLGDNSIWSFPSLFSPLAITAFGGPEGNFSPAIIAFGAFRFIVPKYDDRFGKMELRSLDSLIMEVRLFKVVLKALFVFCFP